MGEVHLFSHLELRRPSDYLALILVNSPTFDIQLVKRFSLSLSLSLSLSSLSLSLSLILPLRLWFCSSLIYCADGAANRLYQGLSIEERPLYLPHSITGDLDSISPIVGEYYRSVVQDCLNSLTNSSMGVDISRVEDQDNNDIDKCLEAISKSKFVLDGESKVENFFKLLYLILKEMDDFARLSLRRSV
jgi:hypothetical protein